MIILKGREEEEDEKKEATDMNYGATTKVGSNCYNYSFDHRKNIFFIIKAFCSGVVLATAFIDVVPMLYL